MTGAKISKIKGTTDAEARRELAQLQIDHCTSARPTKGSTVSVVGGTHTGYAGVISDDVLESTQPFTVQDWNGSPLRGIATKDVRKVDRSQVAEIQIAKSKRPTIGTFVELEHNKMVGEIVDDTKSSEAPYPAQPVVAL